MGGGGENGKEGLFKQRSWLEDAKTGSRKELLVTGQLEQSGGQK